MKITLRKANAVQLELQSQLKSINLSTIVALNEYDDVDVQLETAATNFWLGYDIREKLAKTLYAIRIKVSDANSSFGISSRLGELAYIDKEISFRQNLVVSGAQASRNLINGRLGKLKEASDERVGSYRVSSQGVSTSIFTEAKIEDFKSEISSLKKQKQKLQDQLLELNIRTEISLSSEEISVLENVGIL